MSCIIANVKIIRIDENNRIISLFLPDRLKKAKLSKIHKKIVVIYQKYLPNLKWERLSLFDLNPDKECIRLYSH